MNAATQSLFGLVLLLGACAEEPAVMRGQLTIDQGTSEPAVGATVTILTEELTEVGAVTADELGAFEVEVPRGKRIFVEVGGADLVPAAFLAEIGDADLVEVPDQLLWAVSTETRDTWRQRFNGCPGADGTGGFMVGQALGWLGGTENAPVWPTTYVEAFGPDGSELSACYLERKGVAYDPYAENVGASGYFGMFEMSGFYLLDLTFPVSDDGLQIDTYPLYVPEGGIVTRFPSWVSPF